MTSTNSRFDIIFGFKNEGELRLGQGQQLVEKYLNIKLNYKN